MAFPDDLDNVAAFKIHPAIGVARLANNDDYYEFFESEKKRIDSNGLEPSYMSVRDGEQWVMRQAVRFKVFAYAEDGRELGELSVDVMSGLDVTAIWSATIANRKLNNFSGGSTPVLDATASAAAGETKSLKAANPWRPDSRVGLGEIHGDGLFVPPKGGVYRESENKKIPPYGFHRQDNGVQDTTSDGAIEVSLSGVGDRPVIPACVIVAPQQHSPDVNPGDIGNDQNRDFVKETRDLLQISASAQLEGEGYQMDIAMMGTVNGEYNPGMEICLNRGTALPDPAGAFYPRGEGHIAEAEIRPSYGTGAAAHGALTAGLCSTWQTDLNACLNYWTAEFPNELAFEDAPDDRSLARKEYAAGGPQMGDPEDLNAYIDRMGIGRDKEDDPSYVYGTERRDSDNMGPTPQPPFPLDPRR